MRGDGRAWEDGGAAEGTAPVPGGLRGAGEQTPIFGDGEQSRFRRLREGTPGPVGDPQPTAAGRAASAGNPGDPSLRRPQQLTCFGKALVGSIGAFMLGVPITAFTTATSILGQPAGHTFFSAAATVTRSGLFGGLQFASFIGPLKGSECALEKLRGKHDVLNSVGAGVVIGAGSAVPGYLGWWGAAPQLRGNARAVLLYAAAGGALNGVFGMLERPREHAAPGEPVGAKPLPPRATLPSPRGSPPFPAHASKPTSQWGDDTTDSTPVLEDKWAGGGRAFEHDDDDD